MARLSGSKVRPVTTTAAISPQTPEARKPRVDELRRNRDDAEVKPDQGGRRKRVADTALEDQVHVHQPIAHDGPGKRKRQHH